MFRTAASLALVAVGLIALAARTKGTRGLASGTPLERVFDKCDSLFA